MFNKINEILDTHVKHKANRVISPEELQGLKNHMNILQSLKEEMIDVPDNSQDKLQKIEAFQTNLDKIMNLIETCSVKLQDNQTSMIKNGSESMSLI